VGIFASQQGWLVFNGDSGICADVLFFLNIRPHHAAISGIFHHISDTLFPEGFYISAAHQGKEPDADSNNADGRCI
jgi:hypothetical protein